MQYVLGNMLNGGGINPDGLSLDLQFAADKTFSKPSSLAAGETAITSRRGPSATFLRSTAATEVGPDGLIRYAPENILLRSQEFNLSPWGTNNAMTVTPDATIAPDGTLTADAINFDTNISSRIIYVAGSAVVHTFSVWLRADTNKTCIIATGAVGSAQLGGVVNVTTTWQRFSVVASNWPSGTASFSVRIANNATGTSGTIFAWGAQLERHTSARAYIPTTTAVVYGPRFDHDPVTLACKGLLIEEGRTNLLARSSNFPAGSWSINAGRLTWALDAIGPDGALSATTLTATGLSGGAFINSGGQMTAGVTYTHSAIVKAGSSDFAGISSFDGSNNYGAMFNLATGTFVGYRTDGAGGTHLANSITSLGGGWYRVSFTYTAANTYSGFSAQISISQAGNLNFGTACVAGTSIIAFAYQMEAGSFPTSYIPTTTGTLARSADVCNITGGDFNNFYNQSEGTLFAECQTPSANQYAGIAVIGTTSFTHNIALFKSDATGGTVGNRFVPYVTQAGSLVATHDFGNESGNGNLKVLASVALNNMIFARNGTLSPLDSTAAMPTPNRITIGGRADGNYINGHIAAIRYYKKRLPNAKLVQLTA